MSASMSKVDFAVETLMEIIIGAGEGEKLLPQDELAVFVGVSRPVIREAISKLEYLNIISSWPKRGTTVNAPSTWRTRNTDVIAWQKRAGALHGA